MKKFFLFSLMAVLYTFAANAKELIINGSFEAKDRSFPTAWMPLTRSGAQVQYFREGGPDNKPFIRLTSPKAPAQLHQTNLKLVKGEKYLVGAWFRTKNQISLTEDRSWKRRRSPAGRPAGKSSAVAVL